ncbi:MAG: 2-dehydropantoate 2-reductase [Candidatus Bathyarchaeota archaeon]|nr:2-dehydropantoate 2-reductase [Candidatus Bathyarchaeota archaeon]
MSFQKIFLLGAGAIGSVYGVLLSKRNNVTLIGNSAYTEAVQKRGLSISGDLNVTVHAKADTEIRQIPEEALIVLTTKAHDSAEAARKMNKFLRRDTLILILQNGLGNKDIIKRALSREATLLRGVTEMAAEHLDYGKVRFWEGDTIIEHSEDAVKIAKLFCDSGVKTRLSRNFATDLWSKLITNCVVNPLTAIFRVRNSEVIVESLRTVRHTIIDECAKIAEAEEVALPRNLEKTLDERIAKYSNFSSMAQDIIKGRKTEIDFLNGKIVELGKRHLIPTPINEAVARLIRFMEERK